MIRIDVNGSVMHGNFIINCKTKREDTDDVVVTSNLKVDLEGVSVMDIESRLRAAVTVDLQNRKIRKLPLATARTFTNKTIKWSEIYAKTTVVRLPSVDEMRAMAKGDTAFRKMVMEMAKEMAENNDNDG